MFTKIFNELLSEKNLSYTALAKELNIPQTTISNWLNRGSKPNIEDLIKICDYFNISLDYIIGRESKDNVIIVNDKQKSQIEELYEKLDRQNKIMVLGYITALLQKQNSI
jgi:transcriptional regulator with XRE-family HTH domain